MSLASPRWNKVLRDLWLHKSRTALVGIAISIGIIGAGSVLNTWALLQGATRAEFRASEPASATIRTSGIDEALLEQVRSLPSIMASLLVRGVKMREARDDFNDGAVKTTADRGDDGSHALSWRYGSR